LFINQVKQVLQEYGVNAGTLSKEWVQAIMNQFLQDINVRIARLKGAGTNATPVVTERVETGGGYQWHMYKGSFHCVPNAWWFPRCCLQSLWRQWWIGDQQRQIPPLKYLRFSDVKHIDGEPLEQIEKPEILDCLRTKRYLFQNILLTCVVSAILCQEWLLRIWDCWKRLEQLLQLIGYLSVYKQQC
jgi:hypothetical protein